MRVCVHLPNTAGVASARKGGAQPSVNDFTSVVCGRALTSEAKNVGVIVLAGDRRCLGICDEGGLDADVTICSDAHADTRGANQDAAVRMAGEDAFRDELSVVWVIDGVFAGGAEIGDGMACGLQVADERVFKFDAAVVGSDGDGVARGGVAHWGSLDVSLAQWIWREGMSDQCRPGGWGDTFSTCPASVHTHDGPCRWDR